MTNSRIQNNRALTGSDGGMAGFVGTGGAVTVESSIISGNSAGLDTGGLFAQGTVTIRNSSIYNNTGANRVGGIALGANTVASLTNSTVSGNSSGVNGGGGIFTLSGTQLNLTNSTIAFNTTSGDGGGIYTGTAASHTIVNTIIADNGDTGSNAPDLFGDFSNASFRHSLIQSTAGITAGAPVDGVNGNIVGQDPLLGPLQNNGGTTPTHALLPGSPAIDAGDNSVLSFSLDQRGQIRIFNGTVDIGAFESQTVITIVPPDFDLNPIKPLNALAESDIETVNRDRVSDFLANGQICKAVASLDQYHTQNFAHHLGRVQTQAAPSCAQLQQQLPNDAAMLYVFAQTDKLHLISLTAQGEPIHYESAIARADIVNQISQFQQTLTNPVLRRSDRFLPAAQQLYQWLIEPALSDFQANGIHDILFGLDEGLRTLPLTALHDGQQFLIEQYQATLIPSLALTPTHRSVLREAAVLAVGISEFKQFATLPAVPVELASIKQAFPEAIQFENGQATIDNFQAQLQTQPHQIVHLATHGNFQPGRVNNSYIQFWDQQLNLKQIEQVDWSMADVELLVLSACQTALGDPSVEYGFAGLAVQAEAGAAVAGLWSANDTATLALMSEFYRQLSLGLPKGEALRQAQLALLNGTVRLADKQLVGSDKAIPLPSELHELGDRTFWHPYYWSAFTLIGNPW
ncbi:MAG: CHAT domain-containing protein [Spirulina sp. SIO3F2]|nr:CHAT domain-containing protein [Spirulina sp. SIO3F2]